MGATEAGPEVGAAGGPDGGRTTARLAEEARAGDRAAFDALFLRVAAAVRAYLEARMSPALRAVTTAEDILQDTLARAYQRFSAYEPRDDATFRAWILRIAQNQMLDTYRREIQAEKRAAGRTISLDAPAGGDATPAGDRVAADGTGVSTAIDRAARADRVRGALEELPEEYREVILLCDYRGCSAEEAGRLLGGRTANAARILHFRAIRALGRLLGAP